MLNFLSGGGAMADTILAHDWSDTSIGPPADWPAVLKSTVGSMLASRFPQCLMWGPDLLTIPNAAYRPLMGGKPLGLGLPLREVWGEIWDDVGPIAQRALAGEATFLEDMELTVERGKGPEQAWFTFCYSPIRDEWGHVVGMMDTVIETTGTVLAERRVRIANHELAHRMKNTLAVFQAIASQTLASDLPREEMRTRLDQRLAALGAAHTTLAGTSHSAALVSDIVRQAMLPLVDDAATIEMDGPETLLASRQALSLALGVHELATNAIKYGALSQPGGTVQVRWAGGQADNDDLAFEWREQGGPPVVEPGRRGFGSRLIERVMAADFQGKAALEFAPGGVQFRLAGRRLPPEI
ncbi:sensor histidine kinase [Novosphingobium lentum]|uniref:sensor histidine kinase n=1 Tax=Novosphingobium lentum TaxID=145287 RepID=UPI0008321587|nr:PAS domain-containing sensor histidine kinase [Novosphingobium lentum]